MRIKLLLSIAALGLGFAQDDESAVRMPADSAPSAQVDDPQREEAPSDVAAPETPPVNLSVAPHVIDANQPEDAVGAKEDPGNDIQRRDLEAQESMASAAWAMFWSATVQVVIGGITIVLIFLALRQVCTRFRVVTHPGSALSCGCEIIQHQGIVPVRRMRRG